VDKRRFGILLCGFDGFVYFVVAVGGSSAFPGSECRGSDETGDTNNKDDIIDDLLVHDHIL
jgi:hypothetical protein